MAYQILMPGKTLFGIGAIDSARSDIKAMGTKALVVSGKVVEKSGIIAKLTAVLEEAGIGYTAFTDIKGEPDDLMTAAAKERFDQEGCDLVIGIGGGSPLDAAKAVCALSGYPPLVLVPTTAGSGSEATKSILQGWGTAARKASAKPLAGFRLDWPGVLWLLVRKMTLLPSALSMVV